MAAARSHLAPFLEGPRPYLVVARNAVPVLGIYAFGWSAPLAAFLLWFDAVSALGALCALVIRHSDRLDATIDLSAVQSFLAWVLAMLFFGIPYLMLFLAFNAWYFKGDFWSAQVLHPVVLCALAAILAGNVFEESRRGFARMTQPEIHREFHRQIAMHTARSSAMLLLLFVLNARFFIAVVALALSYVEIYPMRALRFFGREHLVDDDFARTRD